MITFDIRNLDIVVLLQFLSERGSTTLRKIWHSESRITAVFAKENFLSRMMPGQAFVVVVDHDIPANKCRIEATAGSQVYRAGSPESLESAFQESVKDLVRESGWQFDLVPIRILYKGVRCPSCGAVYTSLKVQDDGRVRCQNCDKTFLPDQE
jgi:hypothetical protein